jgi:hypothetical protein
MAVASLIIAIISILIALGSAAYTRRQARAAERLTEIEAKRRHDDLTPQLDIRCTQCRDGIVGLTVELTGPTGLDRLDEVRVRIRDDRPGRADSPGHGLTPERVAAFVWGPYRFNPGVRDTDPRGREHGPFTLPRQEPYKLSLEQTFAPGWYGDPELWRRQYDGTPVRLEVTCRREGHEPWTVLTELVPVDPEEAVRQAIMRAP